MSTKNTDKEEAKRYGWELIMDLKGCDVSIMSSREKLYEFIVKVCDLIEMKRYGEPLIEKFGLAADFTAGYSLVQLIETSSITGHFSDFWGSCYINIFSCKTYDAEKAAQFTKDFFGAKEMKTHFITR
jgi:S-adenosylmethionine/arginine decarboxylase-like enzyme